ncbi:MAG: acyl-CoA reductase [Flavobacteriales bacterium]
MNQLIETHIHHNGWFTQNNIRKALFAWGEELQAKKINQWLDQYAWAEEGIPKKVGIICAGNLPLVGLHDVLSVILGGHIAYVKMSSDDRLLMPALLKLLMRLDESVLNQLVFAEGRMNDMEAIIATGSNNTSRYFEQYFGHLPHIIRKSRTSVAILSGNETDDELKALGNDVFDYFGLGCRNVSKVYLPEGFDINRLFNALYSFNDIIHHHKYANNYDYNKAVWLLNSEKLLDNGFILLKEERSLASPTGSLYYEFYADEGQVREELALRSEEIQCVVSRKDVPFGHSQRPALWDYADGVDTLSFLTELR